jgi:hypothetical protein
MCGKFDTVVLSDEAKRTMEESRKRRQDRILAEAAEIMERRGTRS